MGCCCRTWQNSPMNNKDGANQLWDRKHMNAQEICKKQGKRRSFWKILNGAIELTLKRSLKMDLVGFVSPKAK